MKKNNILFILHMPPPVHGSGLMGQYIRESIFINQNFEADYINLSSSENLEQIGKAGKSKFLRILRLQRSVFKSLVTKKYSLCYMTLTSAGPGFYKDLLIVMLLKLFGRNIIYHFHNKGIAQKKAVFTRMLYKFVFRDTKSILLSPSLYTDIEQFVKREDVFYCANGIPVEVRPKKTSYAKNETKCNLLFLSNMIEQKGVYILLEACYRLKANNDIFSCHFVGPWADINEEKFNACVSKYQLEKHIIVHGKKYGEEKLKIFEQADIFVLPTYNDCFPLVLLEAMQFSLPIVSTYEGGIADIVAENETGFLVPGKNAVALADKLSLLIEEAALREEMGKAGFLRFSEHFTLNHFEKRLVNILQKAISLSEAKTGKHLIDETR